MQKCLVLALVLAGCGSSISQEPEAALSAAARAYRLTTYDVLAVPDAEVTLRAKVELQGPLHRDQRGVPVQFTIAGEDVGSAVSADDGYADLVVSAAALGLGAASGAVPFEARTGTAADGTGAVFVQNAWDPVFITDIDGTISDLNDLLVPVTPIERIPALPGAVAALRSVAVTQTVLYLTARDDALMHHTRAWLALRGFPRGPLVTADWGPGFSQRSYKRRALAAIKEQWRNLTAGVGNAPHDADAYLEAGMRAYNLGPRSVRGAASVASWEEVAAAVYPGLPLLGRGGSAKVARLLISSRFTNQSSPI